MKTILFIKDGLFVGGTTTSFIALMKALCKQDEISVNVWINNPNGREKLLPPQIHLVKNDKLKDAFRVPLSKTGKVFSLFRYHQVLLYLRARNIKRNDATDRNLIPLYQGMDINKAKRISLIDLSEYDAVITWEELFPEYLLAEAILAKKKIAWIHPDYIQCGFSKWLDEPEFEKLNALVAVSNKGKSNLLQTYPQYFNKIKNVNNLLDVVDIRKKSMEMVEEIQTNCFKMVTVGRLQNISKAFDRAIRITARLKREGFNCKWYIIGDGEDKQGLLKLVAKYHIDDMFILLGAKSNPYPYIKMADLFVLQSYYEGRPTTIDEAMILGTPVLVTNYAAANEQVNKDYGWIVENNEDAIYSGLTKILSDQSLIQNKKESLKGLNVDTYTRPDMFFKLIEEVINSAS